MACKGNPPSAELLCRVGTIWVVKAQVVGQSRARPEEPGLMRAKLLAGVITDRDLVCLCQCRRLNCHRLPLRRQRAFLQCVLDCVG